MTDREYIEPNNEQLAHFLSIAGPQITGINLRPDPYVLEQLLDKHPEFRENALKHHRHFQEKAWKLADKMEKGELQCEYIRPNGKRCPNYNEPGSMYCGLHQNEGV